jgi:hypothetical protein
MDMCIQVGMKAGVWCRLLSMLLECQQRACFVPVDTILPPAGCDMQGKRDATKHTKQAGRVLSLCSVPGYNTLVSILIEAGHL